MLMEGRRGSASMSGAKQRPNIKGFLKMGSGMG
jgi:hypothetical protein